MFIEVNMSPRALLIGFGLLASTAALAASGRYEQPDYEVVSQQEGWEVREYAPSIEARTRVTGEREQALNDGFRILANYIFGGNATKDSVAMTAPVTQEPASEKIDMTVPVAAVDEGGVWTVSFMMPSAYTLETLPTPDDPRVELVEVAGGSFAALRFSGRMRDGLYQEQRAALEAALAAAGLEAAGPPVLAQYDPPWKPGFLRTNEVLIPLAPGPALSALSASSDGAASADHP